MEHATSGDPPEALFCSVGVIHGHYADAVRTNPKNSVRPDGAVYQWRKVPPSELSVALVADERFGGATYRAEAS